MGKVGSVLVLGAIAAIGTSIFIKKRNTAFASPTGADVDKNGNLYIINDGRELFKIDAINKTRTKIPSKTPSVFHHYKAIAVDNEGKYVYVIYHFSNSVDQIDVNSGDVKSIGKNASPYIFLPTDIATDNAGCVYITESTKYDLLTNKFYFFVRKIDTNNEFIITTI
jgi:DNA-binding beta-propeller fold protein YncE